MSRVSGYVPVTLLKVKFDMTYAAEIDEDSGMRCRQYLERESHQNIREI